MIPSMWICSRLKRRMSKWIDERSKAHIFSSSLETDLVLANMTKKRDTQHTLMHEQGYEWWIVWFNMLLMLRIRLSKKKRNWLDSYRNMPNKRHCVADRGLSSKCDKNGKSVCDIIAQECYCKRCFTLINCMRYFTLNDCIRKTKYVFIASWIIWSCIETGIL